MPVFKLSNSQIVEFTNSQIFNILNSIKGVIQQIQTSGSLSLVSVEVSPELLLKAIVIETPASAAYLRLGGSIKVLFKETEVIIGTENVVGISLQNRIPSTIQTIEQGALISKLTLKSELGNIASIISTNAVQTLALEVGTSVLAMIKLNEIMLTEC